MGAKRIKGDALGLTVNGEQLWADCTSVSFDQDESGIFHSWGNIPISSDIGWHMDVTAIQSTEEGSLWRMLFEHHEEGPVPYVYSPHGNSDPEPDRPHFIGELIMPQVTILGGEAGKDTEYVFSVTLPLLSKPQMITEPSQP